jgi:uncharacterized membrane protein HdeD (DUF308 family)
MEDHNLNVEAVVPVIRKASSWVVIWSIVTFICGVLPTVLPLTVSFGIALIVGCLILAAGIGHLVFAFQTRSIDGFLWQILVSMLYGIAAICLLVNPLLSVFRWP